MSLELYDARGRRAAHRAPQRLQEAGSFVLPWQPGRLAAGVYLVRLVTESGESAIAKWLNLR